MSLPPSSMPSLAALYTSVFLSASTEPGFCLLLRLYGLRHARPLGFGSPSSPTRQADTNHFKIVATHLTKVLLIRRIHVEKIMVVLVCLGVKLVPQYRTRNAICARDTFVDLFYSVGQRILSFKRSKRTEVNNIFTTYYYCYFYFFFFFGALSADAKKKRLYWTTTLIVSLISRRSLMVR